MKSITIKGKNNIDKMDHIKNTENINEKAIRIGMESVLDADIIHKEQLQMLHKIFIGDNFEYKKLIEREIEKKIQGYKYQDIKKNIYEMTKNRNVRN